MPRNKCKRNVELEPEVTYYKPVAVPLSELQIEILHLDEFEAIRLADAQGLYHDQAAELMNVSRQTFGRIVNTARKKIANAIVNGKAIRIEGGNYTISGKEDRNESNNQ